MYYIPKSNFDIIEFSTISKFMSKETAYLQSTLTSEADIRWRASINPKKKLFGGKSPRYTYLGRYRGKKSKV